MQIDLFLLNNILVVSNKFLSQELNFDHKKQMPVKKKNYFFRSISLNQLTTITNVLITTEISCDTMQISCQKCCHSDWDYIAWV